MALTASHRAALRGLTRATDRALRGQYMRRPSATGWHRFVPSTSPGKIDAASVTVPVRKRTSFLKRARTRRLPRPAPRRLLDCTSHTQPTNPVTDRRPVEHTHGAAISDTYATQAEAIVDAARQVSTANQGVEVQVNQLRPQRPPSARDKPTLRQQHVRWPRGGLFLKQLSLLYLGKNGLSIPQ